MVLRSTSAKVPKSMETLVPRNEPLLHGNAGETQFDVRSPKAIRSVVPEITPRTKVVAAEVALDWVLQEIVQQTRLATNATGAFIGLLRDQKILSQATSGSNAGEFVAYLNRDRRMVDSCLRAGAAQLCRDTESSEGFDPIACRHLGARSVIVVPILDQEGGTLGIFGVFSPQADAFTHANMVAVQSLSRRIAGVMDQVDQCTSVSSAAASVPSSRSSAKLLPTATAGRRAFVRPSALTRTAIWVIGFFAIVALLGWGVSRELGQRAMRASDTVQAAVALPMSGSPAQALPRQELLSPAVPSQTVSLADGNVDRKPTASSVAKSHSPADANLVTILTNPAADVKVSNKTPARAGLRKVPELEIENALDQATPGPLPLNVAGSLKAGNQPTDYAMRSPNLKKKDFLIKDLSNNGGSAPRTQNTPPAVQPREAIHITRAPEPPSTTVAPGSVGMNHDLNSVTSSAPPSGPVMIPEQAALERLVEQVKPEYPKEAMADHVAGAVVVDVVVGKDGQVQQVTPVDGDARLLASAAQAVQKWHFAPILRGGHFVSFETHLTLHFTLP